MDSDFMPTPIPEKLVIYMDTSPDVKRAKLHLADRESVDSFERLQKVIRIFTMNKENACCNGSKYVQFALMVHLGGSPTLLDNGDFHDAKDVMTRLEGVRMRDEWDWTDKPADSGKAGLDIGDIICTVKRHIYICSVDSPPALDTEQGPLQYITRLVMFLTTSRSPITFDVTDELQNLMENPFFTVDVHYLHEEANQENMVDQNIATLTRLIDLQQMRGYVLDSGPDVTDWHNTAALLLSSPIFRISCAELGERKRTKSSNMDKNGNGDGNSKEPQANQVNNDGNLIELGGP